MQAGLTLVELVELHVLVVRLGRMPQTDLQPAQTVLQAHMLQVRIHQHAMSVPVGGSQTRQAPQHVMSVQQERTRILVTPCVPTALWAPTQRVPIHRHAVHALADRLPT